MQPDDAAILREAHARLSARDPLDAGELRPIHGDVHFRNVLWSPEGPRWNDLENACLGPVEYDLAGIAWRGDEGTDEALAAYGEHSAERLELVTPYLALFLAAWTLDLAGRHPGRPSRRATGRVPGGWVRVTRHRVNAPHRTSLRSTRLTC